MQKSILHIAIIALTWSCQAKSDLDTHAGALTRDADASSWLESLHPSSDLTRPLQRRGHETWPYEPDSASKDVSTADASSEQSRAPGQTPESSSHNTPQSTAPNTPVKQTQRPLIHGEAPTAGSATVTPMKVGQKALENTPRTSPSKDTKSQLQAEPVSTRFHPALPPTLHINNDEHWPVHVGVMGQHLLKYLPKDRPAEDLHHNMLANIFFGTNNIQATAQGQAALLQQAQIQNHYDENHRLLEQAIANKDYKHWRHVHEAETFFHQTHGYLATPWWKTLQAHNHHSSSLHGHMSGGSTPSQHSSPPKKRTRHAD